MASTFYLEERNAYRMTFDLVDGTTGDPIIKAQLGTLLCTQYYFNPDLTVGDSNHLATINSRNSQDVLDANDFTVGAGGTVVWLVQPEDTTKLDAGAQELHVALITWQYNGKQNSHQFLMYIRQLEYAEGE